MSGTTPEQFGMYELYPPIILLGEDDDTFRALVAGVLRADGYVVIEAKDGQRLEQLVESMFVAASELRPELVITDIRMPGSTGLDVLGRLRELDWYTPVIVMTGFGTAESAAHARELGAMAVLDKPFDLEDLRKKVQAVVPIL